MHGLLPAGAPRSEPPGLVRPAAREAGLVAALLYGVAETDGVLWFVWGPPGAVAAPPATGVDAAAGPGPAPPSRRRGLWHRGAPGQAAHP
jgi:hypothetical protein